MRAEGESECLVARERMVSEMSSRVSDMET